MSTPIGASPDVLSRFGGAGAVNAGRTTDRAGGPGVFESVLGRAGATGTKEEQARAGAEELISIALIQPVLAQMRESSDAAPPFAPGPYEKQFGSFMDAEISRRLVKAQNFPLVERVARDLLRMGKTTEGTPDDDHSDSPAAQSQRS